MYVFSLGRSKRQQRLGWGVFRRDRVENNSSLGVSSGRGKQRGRLVQCVFSLGRGKQQQRLVQCMF